MLVRPVTRQVNRSVNRGVIRASADDLIAYWDWTGAEPLRSKVGSHLLAQGAGSTVTFTTSGPGEAAVFDGSSDFLVINAADTGNLNIGAVYGNECTVYAWVDRDDTNVSFVAGCWQEDDNDPKRQYGLFIDLPAYGGTEQVCGHVSKTGEPTPGYPFSRDYSANSRIINNSLWEFVAFTYDGQYARSYLGPLFDQRPTFTDSEGQTYSKNPYPFPDGLNTTPCDFTVGAVKLTAGMDNHFQGKIGPLGVYNRALSLTEITTLYRSYLAPGDPVYNFGFFVSVNTNPRGIGWQSASASAVYTDDTDVNPHRYFGAAVAAGPREFQSRLSTTSNIPVVAWSPDMAGISLNEITSVTWLLNSSYTMSLLRFVIKSNDQWYATDATFDLVTPGVSASDWSLAVTQTFTFDRSAAKWRDLTFTAGSALSLAGSARTTDIPDGELQNIGWYSPNNGGNIRIDDLKVFL